MSKKPYGIPPRAYWQREDFQKELKTMRAMIKELGWQEKIFMSPKEVAVWLTESGLRVSRPVTAEQIERWCRTRAFPFTYLRGLKAKFITTNVHVLAWLFSTAKTPIPRPGLKAPSDSLKCPL